jgi:hypothetical protein
MSLGELLDQTFRVYRQHFLLFVGIAAIPHMVILVANTMFTVVQLSTMTTNAVGAKTAFVAIATSLVALAVFLVATTYSMAATVVAVSAVHLDKPITIMEAYGKIKHSVLRLLGVIVGMTLGIILGFVIFIVPGIILALKWALAVPVSVVEDAGLSVATSRSSDLTKGSKGRIFAVLLVVVVLMWVVQAIVGIPLTLFAFKSLRAGEVPLWLSGVNNSLTFLINTLVGPLLTIAVSLIYFDERVRKEAFDIQVLMGSLASAQAATSGQA